MSDRKVSIGAARSAPLALLGVLLAVGAAGCFDAIVGYPCAQGLTACGSVCVDLATSRESCGACGNPCQGQCSQGKCVAAVDAAAPAEAEDAAGADDVASADDGSADDGSADDAAPGGDDAAPGGDDAAPGGDDAAPGGDVSAQDGSADDGASPDAPAAPDDGGGDAPALDGADAGAQPDGGGDAGAPAFADAGDGQPTTDADGDAAHDGTADDASDDVSDAEEMDLPPPLMCDGGAMACGSQCLDVSDDPDNCGSCGNRCSSGLCSGGQCLQEGIGHLVVIGHDYVVGRDGMNHLVGNAVLLAAANPAQVLAYEGAASAGSIAGTNAAINQVAAERGRAWMRTPIDAAALPGNLANADILLIHAQAGASDATLLQLGQDWGSALRTFLAAGRTIVLLDGVSANNAGTFQILTAAGIFTAVARTGVTNESVTVVSPGDAIALRVPRTYRAEPTSVAFVTLEKSVVVQTMAGVPVVVHKAF